jgi:hypothetical protein
MKPKIKRLFFEKPHINHFLFLFFFVSSIIKQIIFKDIKDKVNLSIPIFKLYIYDVGDLLSFIPYLIIKKKSKSQIPIAERKKRKMNEEEIKYIYNDLTNEEFKKNKMYIILFIFLLTILDFIAQISTVTFYLITGNQKFQVKQAHLNITLIFNVIGLFLFSKLFLRTTFRRHHFFSLIVFIVCLIVIVVLDIIQIIKEYGNNYKKPLIFLAIKIFTVILYSLEDVIAKVIFLNYYFTPYFLLLVKAIVQFGYLIIFSFPLIFTKIKLEGGGEVIIYSMFKDIFKEDIYYLYYFIYLVNSFFYNTLNFIIIDKFSANHSGISRIFENFGVFMINIIQKSIDIDSIFGIRLVMYILLIIVSFIFNEILVINICGLANGTKLFLDYKEQKDLSLIKDINSSDLLTDSEKEENKDSNNRIELVGVEYYI